MSNDSSLSPQAIEVLLVAHIFVEGYKREGVIQEVHGRERTEAEHTAHDNNWRLSLTVNLPYHPQVGTRLMLPFIAEDTDSFKMLMENAQRNGIPRVKRLFVIDSVTFWTVDEKDHATCEFKVPNRDAAWNTKQQLKEGFGFEAWLQ